jgi:hypothetical protein
MRTNNSRDLTQDMTAPWGLNDRVSRSYFPAESSSDPEIICAAVLPEQFFHPPAAVDGGAPELSLMRAVMEDAVRCYQKQFAPGPRRNARLAQEAARWFFDDDTTWPYSFLNLCYALGLDPGYIRRRLRRWRATRPILAVPVNLRALASQRNTKLAA